jgi:hypothetical protein
MGWDEHQAVLVAHDDKSHKHVHIMLNAVHPETGLRLNDSFEQRRSQKWALNYEREQGHIYCEQRELSPAERENNMPRNVWTKFQESEREFSRTEKILAENSPEIPEHPKNAEWKILKEFQQAERIEFFAQGKNEFSELRKSIYREVREEFREKWAEYYAARKNCADPEFLSGLKAQITAEQSSVLEPRRDEAYALLRESRDEHYRGILDQQREDRVELGWRQGAGLDNAPFLFDLAERRDAARDAKFQFRETGHEITASPSRDQDGAERDVVSTPGQTGGDGFRVRVFSVGSLLDSLFTDLTNLGSSPRQPEPDRDTFRAAAEEAAKQKTPVEYRSYDDEWKAREKSIYGRD